MIEIRVIGTPGDVEVVLAALRAAPDVDVIRTSGEYATRGEVGLIRVYVTAAALPARDDELSPQRDLRAVMNERYRKGGAR